jgi:FkbM family methyltransferase
MTVLPNDLIGRHLYFTGQFDRTIVEVLLRFAVPDAVVLDIGGNCGYVACALLHALPRSRVVSVEPQRSVHALLAANLKEIGAGRGSAVRAAISDASGVGAMIHDLENSGASRLERAAEHAPSAGAGEPVDMITASELIERCGLSRVDLVKIDVEGHEEPVLRSLHPVLARFRPRAVVFEHDGDPAQTDSGVGRVFRDLDYRVLGIRKRLTRYELVPVEAVARGVRIHDYAAVPRERADAP